MKKLHNLKWFAIGMVTTLILSALTITAFATTGQRQVSILFRDIKVTLDGNQVVPRDGTGNPVEPFLLDGTTYLPLRGIASILGVNVSWDPTTNTVALASSGGAVTVPPPADDTYNRTTPAPIGTLQTIRVDSFRGNYTASVRVIESLRGNVAWELIREANMFNSHADEGYEYILSKIAISVKDVEGDRAVSVSGSNFDVFSNNNVEYSKFFSVVEPTPELRGQVFSGSTIEGWVAFMVRVDDPAPKIVYGSKFDGYGGIWFSLT